MSYPISISRTAHAIRIARFACSSSLITSRSKHSASRLHTSRNTRIQSQAYLATTNKSTSQYSFCLHSRPLTTSSATPAASSASSMEGTCLCKAIQLKVTDDNLFGEQRRGHICHCSNCRKVAGGLFGANLIIEEDKVEWVRGRDVVKVYEDRDTLSGKPVYRHFCPDCGVPIMSVAESIKGKVILKLGIYPKLPVPEWESFAAERQSWEKPYEGCVQYKIKSFGEKMEGSP